MLADDVSCFVGALARGVFVEVKSFGYLSPAHVVPVSHQKGARDRVVELCYDLFKSVSKLADIEDLFGCRLSGSLVFVSCTREVIDFRSAVEAFLAFTLVHVAEYFVLGDRHDPAFEIIGVLELGETADNFEEHLVEEVFALLVR